MGDFFTLVQLLGHWDIACRMWVHVEKSDELGEPCPKGSWFWEGTALASSAYSAPRLQTESGVEGYGVGWNPDFCKLIRFCYSRLFKMMIRNRMPWWFKIIRGFGKFRTGCWSETLHVLDVLQQVIISWHLIGQAKLPVQQKPFRWWRLFWPQVSLSEEQKNATLWLGSEVLNRPKDLSDGTVYWLVVWLPFFIFPYIGNNHPNWLSYFSEGFKPPTSLRMSIGALRTTEGWVPSCSFPISMTSFHSRDMARLWWRNQLRWPLILVSQAEREEDARTDMLMLQSDILVVSVDWCGQRGGSFERKVFGLGRLELLWSASMFLIVPGCSQHSCIQITW